jgi:hypothetical protein
MRGRRWRAGALALGIATGAAASAEPAADACRNAYQPVGAGALWVYRESVTSETQLPEASGMPSLPPTQRSVTRRVRRVLQTGAAFDESHEVEGGPAAASATWACTAEGLRAPAFGAQFPLGAIAEDALAAREEHGVDLPRDAAWKVGAAWTRSAEERARPGSDSPVRSRKLTGRYTIAAREPVAVPAGAFDAFRVDSVLEFEFEGPEGPQRPFRTVASHWYAPGVGLVKSRYRSDAKVAHAAGTADVTAHGQSELAAFTPPAAAR